MICAVIVELYSNRAHLLGRDVNAIIKLKDDVIRLAEEIKSCKKEDILRILQRELPTDQIQDF